MILNKLIVLGLTSLFSSLAVAAAGEINESLRQDTPARIDSTSCQGPTWPDEARRFELEGNVVVGFAVRQDGKVVDSRIIKSSGFKVLDEATVSGMINCTFIPARKNGDLVNSILKVNYTWKLKNVNKDKS